MENTEIWTRALGMIQRDLSEIMYRIFIDPLCLESIDNGVAWIVYVYESEPVMASLPS